MKLSALAASLTAAMLSSFVCGYAAGEDDGLSFDPLGANREYRSENFRGTLADPGLPARPEKPAKPAGRPTGPAQTPAVREKPEKPVTPQQDPEKKPALKPDPKTPARQTRQDPPPPAERIPEKPAPSAPENAPAKKPAADQQRPLTDQEIRARTERDMKGTFIRKIPGQEMYVIIKNPAAKNPRLQFADSSGRFAIFNGQLYDLWDHQKNLNTPQLIDYAFTHIPLDNLRKASGLNEISLAPKNAGGLSKGREVFIFADPRDTGTVQLIKDITDNINSAYYHIRIILLNSTGDNNTERLLRDFACSDATAKEKALSILKQDFKLIYQTAKQCKADDRMQRNRDLAETLGIRKLPFMITPSGRYAEGAIDEPFDYIQNIRK